MEVTIKEAIDNLDILCEMLIKGTVKEIIISIWDNKEVAMKRYETIKELKPVNNLKEVLNDSGFDIHSGDEEIMKEFYGEE